MLYTFLASIHCPLTCAWRRLERNPAICHCNPFLRDFCVRAFAQVNIGHILPCALWSCVHTKCGVGELNFCLVALDVPLLLWLRGDGLTVERRLDMIVELEENTYTTSVLPFVRVFGTITYLVSCLEVI